MSELPAKITIQFIVFSFVVLFIALSCNVKAAPLVIGTISSDPVEELRKYTPFAKYLSQRLRGDGVDDVTVAIATDVQQMAGMLRKGTVDLFIDSSVTASIVNQMAGSQFLLRRWKKGRDKYRSVIFTTANSEIRGIEDLRGKVIAFEEPFSTSGFVLPALILLQSGLALSPMDNVRAKPDDTSVGYLMAYDNETQFTWLERGRVAAAAMAEKDYEEYAKNALMPMRVLQVTPYVPYHVVVNRSDLDKALVQRIKNILQKAHKDTAGAEILRNFEKTTRFDEIPQDLLNEVQKLMPFVGKVAAL
ncbi:MAG: hypothetical protein COB29_16020 [Sulfitobacter sp.]|nr:MAG: hypothetical protein COB29_16020 [Sulfitobacter sp.]